MDRCTTMVKVVLDKQKTAKPTALVPQYPKPPFSPQLCKQLSCIPVGFSDLALDGKLSTLVIDLLESIAKGLGQRSPNQDASAIDLDSILPLYSKHGPVPEGVSDLETCICTACLCTIIDLANIKVDLFWMKIISALAPVVERCLAQGHDMDCLAWVVTVGAACSTVHPFPPDTRRRLLMTIRQKVDVGRRWDSFEQILRRFFWNDTLAVRWRTDWAYLDEIL